MTRLFRNIISRHRRKISELEDKIDRLERENQDLKSKVRIPMDWCQKCWVCGEQDVRLPGNICYKCGPHYEAIQREKDNELRSEILERRKQQEQNER